MSLPTVNSAILNQNQNGLKNLLSPGSIKQSITALLNSSLIFKVFSVGVLIGYLLTFKNDINQYLSVIPGKLLPPNFYLWTLITHSFVEYRFLEVLTDWFVILLYSKMLEPLWGRIECIQFFLITTILVALSTAFIYFVAYAATFNELLLFNVNIHGLGALLGGFSVACKQIMPDTVLIDLNFIRLKQDNLPLLLVLASFLIYLLKLAGLTYFIMLTLGVFYSWVYLRFFQKHKNGTRGDSSSTFVFASFFPSQIQPFVAIISNTIFNLLVRMKICKATPKRNTVGIGSSSQSSSITITIPLVKNRDNIDDERRRLKALKALKERLKKPGEEDDLKSQWTESSSLLDQPLMEVVNETSDDKSKVEEVKNETITN